jgi:perosamine synthetase
MVDNKYIPLSVPNISGNEWNYVKECLDTAWISSAGGFVDQFETAVAEYSGSKYGISTVNGTSALHLALILAGVTADDYVILPNLTFVASANAIRYLGAEPIFVDVDKDLWQMDLSLLEAFFENDTFVNDSGECCLKKDRKRIAAVMPVHVLGNMCDMDRLVSILEKYNVSMVEDSAESLGSTYKNKHAGTFGRLGCLSFNGNKIISTGGGGLILTDNADLALRAKHLSTTAKVNPEEFYHDEVGFNFRMVNVLAALGVAQMEQLPLFLEKKREAVSYYRDTLQGVGDISFQLELPGVNSNGFQFTILSNRRDKILNHLRSESIECRKFWVPMNQLPMYSNFSYLQESDFSTSLYNSGISIPCSTNITEEQLVRVVSEIKVALK